MSRVGLVATDLDGTLLDRETYDFAPARPALDALREARVPLVLCSSKTRAEMEPLAVAIGAPGPLVVENGGAVVHRRSVPPLGAPRDRLLVELPAVAREAGVRVRPFAAMSVAEVAALTGLPPEQAALAMRREYDEPFVVEDPPGRDLEVDARLDRAARGRGLRVTHGGRVHHLTGPADKGRAVGAGARLARRRSGRGPRPRRRRQRPPAAPRRDPPDRHAAPRRHARPGLAERLRGKEREPGPGPAGGSAAVLAALAGEPLPREGA